MKIILLSLFAGSLFISNLIANNDSNATASKPEATQITQELNQAVSIAPADPDVKLKDDIVGFEREKHFQNNAKIDDPFIYVYPKTEDEVARRADLEQIVLTYKLKSIIVSPDSNDDGVKRYKAHINDKWVEECRLVDKKTKCDYVSDDDRGWKVTSIKKDKVTLRVDSYNLTKVLKLAQDKVKIDKKEVNFR